MIDENISLEIMIDVLCHEFMIFICKTIVVS